MMKIRQLHGYKRGPRVSVECDVSMCFVGHRPHGRGKRPVIEFYSRGKALAFAMLLRDALDEDDSRRFHEDLAEQFGAGPESPSTTEEGSRDGMR